MNKKILFTAFGLALAIGGLGLAVAVHYFEPAQNQIVETSDNNNSVLRLLSNTESSTDTTTSTYEIKDIEKIYTPKSIDATRLVSQMRDFMGTKDGVVDKTINYVGDISLEHSNEENYSFTFKAIKDSLNYSKNIDVEILSFDYKMGYVKFSDGDIAVLYNSQEDYTHADIEKGVKAFLESQNISTDELTIPNQSYYLTKTYEGSYSGGKLYVVCSGVNIYYTSLTAPTDESKEKEGYVGMDRLEYTSEFTREQALNIVKNQLLLYNGELVKDYTVTFTEKEGSNYVNVEYKKNGLSLLKDQIYCKQIESSYTYVFVRSYSFDYGYIATPKQETTPAYDLNTFMADIIKTFRTILGSFSNTATIDFTKKGTADVDGVYRMGNGAYYSYEYNVEIIDTLQATTPETPSTETPTTPDDLTNNEPTTDEGSLITNEFIDSVKSNFDKFKTQFEENNIFKATTIIIGSITGLAIVWVIWAVTRKIIKWLKK